MSVNQSFNQFNDVAKKIEGPLREITELNLKTLQSFRYLKPDELTRLKKPEEWWEKQLNFAVENGHKTLNYLQKSFEIFEKATLSLLSEAKSNSKRH